MRAHYFVTKRKIAYCIRSKYSSELSTENKALEEIQTDKRKNNRTGSVKDIKLNYNLIISVTEVVLDALFPTPRSDQHVTSTHVIATLSSQQLTRIEKKHQPMRDKLLISFRRYLFSEKSGD